MANPLVMMVGDPWLPDGPDMSSYETGEDGATQQTNTERECPGPAPISPSPSYAAEIDDADADAVAEGEKSSRALDALRRRRMHGNLPPKKRPNRLLMPEPKRASDGRVSFEEMKRLMRVYGPTKCLRNRTPRESGKGTKVLSVKRKFYRWFPDFHDRFVPVREGEAGGWYRPRIGHEEEMRYREELRRIDQARLAAKRTAKKCGGRGPSPQA